MSKTGDRSLLRIVLAVVLVSGGAAGGTVAGPGDSPQAVDSDDGLIDDGTNTTADETTTTTDSTETVVEDTDDTTDTVTTVTDDTTDTVETVVDDTTDTVENTTDDTTDTVENTTDDTTDTVETVVDDTTDAVENTTDDTTDTVETVVDDTTDAVENTTDDTTDLVENTTDESTETVETGDTEGDDRTTRASETTTAANGTAATGPQDGASETPANAGPDSDSGPTLPGPTGMVAGAVVAGAAGAAALSASGASALQSPGFVRTGALHPRTALTGARAWLADLGDRFWRMAGLLRYSRWDGTDPLEHEGRREVFDTVEDAPGIYLSALEDRTDHSLSTLRHHLRILEEEGLITTEKVRGKRRYFPVQRGGSDPALLAALDDPATERILTTLAEEGPASGGDLADALDRDASTISHHLSRLEEEGVVVREREGRAVVNRLSDSAAMALSEDARATGEESPAPADD